MNPSINIDYRYIPLRANTQSATQATFIICCPAKSPLTKLG